MYLISIEHLTSVKSELESQVLDLREQLGCSPDFCCKALFLAEKTFYDTNHYVRKGSFPNTECEVYYFKEVLPYILSEMFYYKCLATFESQKARIVSPNALKDFCKKRLQSVKSYFSSNSEVLAYCASGNTNRNAELFTLGSPYNLAFLDEAFIFPEELSLVDASIIRGRGMAYLRMNEVIYSVLHHSASAKNTEMNTDREKVPALRWSAKKAYLIELAYSLYAAHAFNSGQCGIAQVVKGLERAFGVSLGNFYDTFSDIRSRKNPTLFLDRLKGALKELMDDIDG